MNRSLLIIIAIATILIAGCTITGNTPTMTTEEVIGCSLNTEIDFLTINDRIQACYRGSSIYFAIDNTGSNIVTGLSVYLQSDYNITLLIKGNIDPGESIPQNINFGIQELRDVRSLTVYPLTGDPKNKIVCRNAAIQTEIEAC
jgi:hypothetical protein